MAETYQIEMNLEQLERLLKNLPEGIMLEICFGKEQRGLEYRKSSAVKGVGVIQNSS